MRNLVVLNKGEIVVESRTYPELRVLDSVFDSISDTITVALGKNESGIIEVHQFMKDGQVLVLASFSIDPNDKLLSFEHFGDSSQLVFVFELGDIVTATYDITRPDSDTTLVEIVGSIDCGIATSCWSPDQETLALLTKEQNLILLSRLFEPIAERFLDPNDVKQNTQVSVGWGKKETQFKGKGARALEREKESLKHAGLENTDELRDPTLGTYQSGGLSPFDSQSIKISWRGDCEYFSITSIVEVENNNRRVIRVYSRNGQLDSCSEPIDGLEGNLSWKPQGSLIASTQRRHDEDILETVLDLVFFERNGLRHGEFGSRLPPNSKIIDLAWSCNSEILAFQLENSIQLWTSKNYHWYLKQELFLSSSATIEVFQFHPEKPLRLMIASSHSLEIVDLAFNTKNGPNISGFDVGMSLVVDGTTCMITPLSIANVPPPVAFRDFDVLEPILDLAVSKSNTRFATLTANYTFIHEAADLRAAPKEMSLINKTTYCSFDEQARQIAVIGTDHVAILVDSLDGLSRIVIFSIEDISSPEIVGITETMNKVVLLKPRSDFSVLTYETIDGTVYEVEMSNLAETKPIVTFPQLCFDYEVSIRNPELWADEVSSVCFGISSNGKLYGNDVLISPAVTSIKITESLLVFTTAQHQLKFVHLMNKFETANDIEDDDERTRMIERGSLLVSVIPSRASVVLQAPRGNLETIYPRIMVLTGVRKDIKALRYKEAFSTCRTHRIDLDILHDYDPQLFFDNLELFVNELSSVEYLDLFLSCLHEEDVSETKYKETLNLTSKVENLTLEHSQPPVGSKVNRICEGILTVLLRPEYSKKYWQSILTAYACQNPPNLEDALRLIGSFTEESEIEKSVQHLCFLQDVNKIYNIALSLYDIPLTLMVAQQSQKDPKEYLPFLQNLHVQPQLRKEFLINDHLKNYEKALRSLSKISAEEQQDIEEEIIDYIVSKKLFQYALNLYHYDNEKSRKVLEKYADYLHGTQEFVDAAITYEMLGDKDSALEDYILAKRWQEALSIATTHVEAQPQLKDICERLIAGLNDMHDYSSSAEIELKYLNNVEESLRLFGKDYQFDRAILTCVDLKRPELIESIIDPSIREGFGIVAELLADCKGQVNSQLNRLRELRAKKQEDPYAFYGDTMEQDTPDNVSIAASETSTKESFFTRYTGKTAGTAKTGASRKTAKNRRREERKKARGKKGTIYEEEYLVKSVGRLIERLENTEAEAVRLIEALIRRNMREQAYQIQKQFVEVLNLLKANIQEIYDIKEKDRERVDDNGMVYYVPEIPVPTIRDFPEKLVLKF
ncbi:Elongator complex protein 1 [Komagataella phaffii CBS 7435]|uniref:Elongator complex protein 1 n=2 Tax=Komagataella phaffii TaxID=460519 RepID=C4R2C6_KOMPG|nr:Subunit of Elongator complex, which is required for modification of wobble nucleosides in tRNA [Komagataella phaffii GS115]AOA62472.1 GQ67_01068T0 [Komagataella phaffii]CAH2447798.1 Elongator complex protein 1 [Komagataella phaffii CBS 7435]AOA67582.1 GQ68_00321T0 [Komagataella phaffii GS115]CAY69650.1 Subunit of Elongator complex, which is required for modification of wobble nucleosides in tRNA [Komagataella phaffii GS115]CCA37970.1 Elongator complex protein 1 [Komagataella phaffii CBS 743